MGRKSKTLAAVFVVTVSAAILSAVAILVVSEERSRIDMAESRIDGLEKKIRKMEEKKEADIDKIERYLKLQKSLSPRDVATACVEHGRDPFLLAAIAIIESNANPWSPAGAAGERGAWQVQAKHWGNVPADVFAQARQAEGILRQMIDARGSVLRGVIAYNGAGPAAWRYAQKVMRIREAMMKG